MTSSDRPVIVVKIGTSTLMREPSSSDGPTVSSTAGRLLNPGKAELAISTLSLLVDTLLALRRDGFDVILVSSGAVGVGCNDLKIQTRPKVTQDMTKQQRADILAQKQAYAAIGQSVLMRTYDSLMSMANQKVAQVLLTSGDLGSEYQYKNAKNTLSALLQMGVIPIVNENDTVATEELKYGDNDWLSALVSTVVKADWLFLLTDVEQLYTSNPRCDANAKPIDLVPNIENLQVNMSTNSTGTQWGTGGMNTKITAARLATAAGVRVCLVHGRYPPRVLDFIHDKAGKIGTVFEPLSEPLEMDKKRWISNCLPPRGEVIVSKETELFLRAGAPLLAVGVKACKGVFEANSAVRVKSEDGVELARGICNYTSEQLQRFKGMSSQAITSETGYPVSERVIHEEKLALLVDPTDELDMVKPNSSKLRKMSSSNDIA